MTPAAGELAATLDMTGKTMSSMSRPVHPSAVTAASGEHGRRERDQKRCAEDGQRGVSHVFENSGLPLEPLRVWQTPRETYLVIETRPNV
ncbi:MAG TPA: hypothetical protein VE567_08220 [Sphingomonas sp.]|nr:hypothetical protein [Sphingomonas sp.]